MREEKRREVDDLYLFAVANAGCLLSQTTMSLFGLHKADHTWSFVLNCYST
jgi:hypothetical protein